MGDTKSRRKNNGFEDVFVAVFVTLSCYDCLTKQCPITESSIKSSAVQYFVHRSRRVNNSQIAAMYVNV